MVEVVILAVLQGVAEFLPVSSSGHLVVAQHLLGVNEPGMRLDLCLHVGTLASIFFFYRGVLWRIVRERQWRYVAKIALSSLPAIVVYACCHDFIDGMFANAQMVGALLMFTGAVLIGTRYMSVGQGPITFGRALLMGFGQALALLPGVSRSGMTLASARAGGVDPDKSAEFSFLMSAPLIIGGMALEIIKSFRVGESAAAAENAVGWGLLTVGTLIAAVVGYFSLALLVQTLRGKRFWFFGPYCLAAGLLTVILV